MKFTFEDNTETVQAHLITYSQIRDLEDAELAGLRAAAGGP